MTGSRRATTLAAIAIASAFAGAPAARAQTQPPPFDERPARPGQERSTQPGQPARPPATTPPSQSAAPSQSGASKPAQAPPDDADAIDDPKVSRRLGTRIVVPPPPSPPVTAPQPAARPPGSEAQVAGPPAPSQPPVQPIPSATEATTGVATLERPYKPIAEGPFRASLPRLKLALRRFDFVQIGASESPSGIAAPETFNSLSLDIYPVSRIVRVGLSTAFGWQSGTWLANGDYFATQSASIGGQYDGFGRIVPFVEAFAGVGYMRRLQFDRTVPTAYWQFGADAGVEIYVAKVGYLSFAVGYLRPVNGFAKRQQFTTVFVDTWSFKVGIGI